jgi:flagellar basal-body rod protein FlgC
MEIFPGMLISASGLTAERTRMNVIANNIANVNTTKTADGSVFRRKLVELMSVDADRSPDGVPGVQVQGIVEDPAPFKMSYEPNHPDANAQGYVTRPNVDIMMEMVDLISASRSYEANVTVLENAKNMVKNALAI